MATVCSCCGTLAAPRTTDDADRARSSPSVKTGFKCCETIAVFEKPTLASRPNHCQTQLVLST